MFTLDASVIIKWLFPEKPDEQNAVQAIQLLKDYEHGAFEILEPVHYLAEIAAVAARISPKTADEKIALMTELNMKTLDSLYAYQVAIRLSGELNHHLFDTLYHAIPLVQGKSTLITADKSYYKKAKRLGYIQLLDDL